MNDEDVSALFERLEKAHAEADKLKAEAFEQAEIEIKKLSKCFGCGCSEEEHCWKDHEANLHNHNCALKQDNTKGDG